MNGKTFTIEFSRPFVKLFLSVKAYSVYIIENSIRLLQIRNFSSRVQLSISRYQVENKKIHSMPVHTHMLFSIHISEFHYDHHSPFGMI